ncbi:MAG: hypothetical protein V4532_03665 [Pseudomonadota bacterium]
MKFTKLTLAAATVLTLSLSAFAAESKKELIQKLPPVQKAQLESLATGLTQEPVRQILEKMVRPAMMQAVPADKREATGKLVDAEITKYFESATPLVKTSANKVGPAAVAALLDDKFTEEELRQLLTMLDSPIIKKYQAALPEIQQTLLEKISTDARPAVDPKLQTLQNNVVKILDTASGGKLSQAAAAAQKAAASSAQADTKTAPKAAPKK